MTRRTEPIGRAALVAVVLTCLGLATRAEAQPAGDPGASSDRDAGTPAAVDLDGATPADGEAAPTVPAIGADLTQPPNARPPSERAAPDDAESRDAGTSAVSAPLFGLEEPDEVFTASDAVTASPRDLAGEHGAIFTELGFTGGGPGGASLFAFSPEIGLRLWASQDFLLESSFGLTVSQVSVSGREELSGGPVDYASDATRVDPGNPVMSARYTGALDESLRLEVGFLVGIPLAAREEPGSNADTLALRAASEATHHAALSMRGYYDPWRWAPERLSLAVPARLVGRLDAVLLEAELAVAVMVPVLGDDEGQIDFFMQGAAGVGVDVVGPLHMGVRLRVAGATSPTVLPGVLASAEPWLRLRFDPVQIGLRGSINLHGHDGLVGNRGPGFGLFLGVGTEI